MRMKAKYTEPSQVLGFCVSGLRVRGIEMNNMPEKDPAFWAAVVITLREHGLVMMLTFVLSYLRIRLYSEQPTIARSVLEAAVGALLVMIVGMGIQAAGMNMAWTLFTAGFIGILGIDQARVLGKRWAERKVGGTDGQAQ